MRTSALRNSNRVENIDMSTVQANLSEVVQPVSYAYNFKVRLLNADPEKERQRDIQKDRYKRELQLQMEADRKRKEQEKKKIQNQDLKYERAFYENLKIEAKTTNKTANQPNFIMRSAQRNRNKANYAKINPEKADGMPVSRASGNADLVSYRNFPQIVVNRQVRDNSQRVINEYSYEDQRLSTIHYFQQAILKKMDSIKDEIRKAASGLECSKQAERIRSLLKSKSIYTEEGSQSDIEMYRLRTPNTKLLNSAVMGSRSFVYETRDVSKSRNASRSRKPSEELSMSQYNDKVEILPVRMPTSKRRWVSPSVAT